MAGVITLSRLEWGWVVGRENCKGQAEVYTSKEHIDVLMKIFKLESLSLRDLLKRWPLSFLQLYEFQKLETSNLARISVG